MSLLAPLSPDQQSAFLVVALPRKLLRKLVGQLGTAPKGTRPDALGEWELADSLIDYYHDDAEVAAAVDKALRRELGDSPLADAVATPNAAQGLLGLVLSSADPLRDAAWALLRHAPDHGGAAAATLVQTIVDEYDAADERAREEAAAAEQAPATDEPAEPAPSPAVDRTVEREAARARTQRARALKRLGGVKDRLVEVEQRLAAARQELRAERSAHQHAATARDRAEAQATRLRERLAGGAGGEIERLQEAVEAAERRAAALGRQRDEAREAEAAALARLRAPAGERSAAGAAAPETPAERAGGASWSLPVFTDEFYESIRRWDRKVVRTAFEKIQRLAEDWRHPSLRAIPLEGLPGFFRIRIASDVRLIYRPGDGGRLEILSLIDREDLQRYIRTAKTR